MTPKALVKLTKAAGMPAVAVTDSMNMFGALEFSMAAADSGVQPIIGCLLRIDMDDLTSSRGALASGGGKPGQGGTYAYLPVLAQNETGYKNLLHLVSQGYLEHGDDALPHVTLDMLADASEGVLAMTGGPDGPLAHHLDQNRSDAAEAVLSRLTRIFLDRLYVELQRHDISSPIGQREARHEAWLVAQADQRGLPLLATNDCHFSAPDMYEAHDALLCIAQGRYVSEKDRPRLTPDHGFKSAQEMRDLFTDLPDACDNTLVVARRCAFMPRKRAPILPPFPNSEGLNEEDELRRQAHEGLDVRLAALPAGTDLQPYRDRLEFELGVIIRMGFAGYFLIVSDFIRWAKNQGIPVGPGRGSGAASVVAWSLLITDLDPLRFGLLFERFLNPERVSMPDFDVDFCQERRDEVIRYVQERYGAERVAQIITFGKLQARAVLRDVGRVLQMPYGQVDKICKQVPNNPADPPKLVDVLANDSVLQEMKRTDSTVARLFEIAQQLEGLYRHASTHAAGLVIGDRPLEQLVPLYRDPRAVLPVTQFNMKYVELAGLVKFDFLGLKTLTVIQKTLALLRQRGVNLTLEQIPFEDEKSFTMMSCGDTTGVFQLESAGMRDVLRRLRPNRFEDIIALVALYRPGPMDNIPKYIKVKMGEEPPHYPHPLLEPVLLETYGIPVYQEQVMQIAQVLSGYSLGEADLLRRAMGKKIASEMQAQRARFVEGAVERGVDRAQAESIFELMDKFAGYGFNKAHAAAYALIAWHTAWLKANYPVEFMAATMTYDMGNTDRLSVLRQELGRLHIPLLPPDINASGVTFTVETDGQGRQAIRYALAAIKGVGATAMQSLVGERDKGGTYHTLADFAKRIDAHSVNSKMLDSLTRSGALDGLHRNRAQVIAGLDRILNFANRSAQDRASGQGNLFGDDDQGGDKLSLPPASAWDSLSALQHEFDAVGFYLSSHPLDAYRSSLRRLKVLDAASLTAARHPPSVCRMAGIVVGKRERTARSGNRFAFVQLSDATGLFEVTVFSEVLSSTRDWLEAGTPLLLSVEVQASPEGGEGGAGRRLTAQSIELLDQAAARLGEDMCLRLLTPAAAACLAQALKTHAKPGRGKLSLLITLDDGAQAEIDLPGRYQLGPVLQSTLLAVEGVGDAA